VKGGSLDLLTRKLARLQIGLERLKAGPRWRAYSASSLHTNDSLFRRLVKTGLEIVLSSDRDLALVEVVSDVLVDSGF